MFAFYNFLVYVNFFTDITPLIVKRFYNLFQMVVILLYGFSIVVVLTVTKSGEDPMDNEEL